MPVLITHPISQTIDESDDIIKAIIVAHFKDTSN